MNPAWLWSSIAVTPAVKPKLASIWYAPDSHKLGCRFPFAPFLQKEGVGMTFTKRPACSPSSSLVHILKHFFAIYTGIYCTFAAG
jgi:hypothetical protein